MQKNISADKLLLPFVKFFVFTLFCTFSFLIICGLGNTGISDPVLMSISFTAFSLLFALFSFKISRRICYTLIFLGILAILLGSAFATLPPPLKITSAFKDIFINYSSGNAATISLLTTVILILAVYSYSFAVKKTNPAALSLITGALFVFQLLSGSKKDAVYFIFLFAILIFSIFLRSYIRADSVSFLPNTGLRGVSVYALITVTVAITLSLILPYPSTPLVDNSLSRAAKGNLSYYSLSAENKFEEESPLGGTPDFTDDKLFTVITDRRIRLTGSIKTEYTGHSWRFGDRKSQSYNKGASADFAEISRSFNAANKYNLLIFNRAEIQTKDVSTNTLFVPPLVTTVECEALDSLYIADDGTVFSSKPTDNIHYAVESCIIDLKNKETRKLLFKSQKGAYDNINSDFESITKHELLEKRAQAYGECLQLPDSLPERVVTLANELTADCKNNLEKAEAVEAYLMRFKYTTDPQESVDSADFVDSFLFEQKEGYCTYFSTAMAVLCRCAGVPSRYVEGYVLPADFEKSGDGKIYSISGKEAHSWVQLYFEGVGWVDFEPTPPYSYLERGEQIPRDIFENQQDAESFGSSVKDDRQSSETEKDHQRPTDDQSQEPPPESTTPAQATTQNSTSVKPVQSKPHTEILPLFAIPLLILLVLSALSIITGKSANKAYAALKRMNHSRAARLIFNRIEENCGLMRIRRGSDETVGDFIKTSSAVLGIPCNCASVIERALYAEEEITGDEFNEVLRYYDTQRSAVKKSLSKSKRFIYSRLLHKI